MTQPIDSSLFRRYTPGMRPRPRRAAELDVATTLPLIPRPSAAPDGPALRALVLTFGGSARRVAHYLTAHTQRDAAGIDVLAFDTDHTLDTPLVAADGSLLPFPDERFVRFGVEHPRDAMRAYPVLLERYQRQLNHVSVFSTYGGGDGCEPVNAALQFELSIDTIRSAIHQALARVQSPDGDPWADVFGEQADQAATPLLVVIIGSGSGSVGAASHILAPYLVRQEAERLDVPITLVGLLTGPTIYRGVLKGPIHEDRTQRNWLATARQLERLTHAGLSKRWINGPPIDAPTTPPYDAILLADREPASERSTSAEIDRFAHDLAQSLYPALSANLFAQLRARHAHEQRTPWMTLAGASSEVDWPTVQAAATARLASAQLRRMAG